jgi:integrase
MPRLMTDKDIGKLKPGAKRYTKADNGQPGLYVRVSPKGAKTFAAVTRGLNGKVVWITIGDATLTKIDEARDKARVALKAIKEGKDPSPPQSFQSVSADWFRRHVEKKGLRSKSEIVRHLGRMNKAWSERDFTSIRRGDITKHLDQIEDKHGTRQADYALAVIRHICGWYAARHEGYDSPIVKGMRRTNPKESQRTRTLDDNELRAVWKQAEANGTFGAMVRLLLLTAQRRDKVASMRWADVSDGKWSIPAEKREKGNAGILALPQVALDIIEAQPRLGDNPHVFAGRGSSHFSGYSKGKKDFDAKLNLAPWTLHDLRRTARSLMSRAGVRPDLAERVLGHAMAGIEGVYDRHGYQKEKAEALASLAALVGRIVEPPSGNVIELGAARNA